MIDILDFFALFWYWIPLWIISWSSPWWIPKTRKALQRKKTKKSICANGTGATITNDEPGKELAVPSDIKTPPVYEMYDHPAPPIALLGASLPTAPLGYGWELLVLPNEEGNPALRLAMLDLSTSKVVDAIEGDLIVIRRWKYAAPDTYAAFYRRVEQECAKKITGFNIVHDAMSKRQEPIYGKDPTEMKGKVMMANLVTPMVDWARLITLRYIVEHPDETKCNYMLIESQEGASA